MRPTTEKLIHFMGYDEFPDTMAVYVDFGIDPKNPNPHYGALQWGWKNEAYTVVELDAALGDGSALTKLVQRRSPRGSSNPYACMFKTLWDDLPKEDDEESL